MKHFEHGDITLKVLMFRLMLSLITKTWNISVQPEYFPEDKLGGLHFYPDSIWSSDFGPVASEQNPMHSLVDLTSTQKGRESLSVQLIHKIVDLFFPLRSCPRPSELPKCFR